MHLGWTRDIPPAELAGWVDEQDVSAMLAAMHVLTVAAGDTVYVPPGTVHAIGAGVFLVEVQQAADLSVLLEWKDFFADGAGAFLGVERAAALGCVDLHGLAPAAVEALVGRAALDLPSERPLLPPQAARYFSSTLIGAGTLLSAEYRTLVVLSGVGTLTPVSHGLAPATSIVRGETLAVPAGAGPLALTGSHDLRILAFGAGHRSL